MLVSAQADSHCILIVNQASLRPRQCKEVPVAVRLIVCELWVLEGEGWAIQKLQMIIKAGDGSSQHCGSAWRGW